MSQYNFYDLITNAEDIDNIDCGDPIYECYLDILGYNFTDWASDVVLGWDDGLETYFMHACESHLDVGPVWWFGNTPNEILSPYHLTAILSRTFHRHQRGSGFLYSRNTLCLLKNDRDQYLRSAATSKYQPYAEEDARWIDCSLLDVSLNYTRQHVRDDKQREILNPS